MITVRRGVHATIVAVALAVLSIAPAAAVTPAGAGYFASSAHVDLGPALSADGTFVGAPNSSGSVDLDRWALTSDLAAGEAPRFEPASANAPAAVEAITPNAWSPLGCCSNGAGTQAVNSYVYAVAVWGSSVYVGGNFSNAGGNETADFIAQWSGSAWLPLPHNTDPEASALSAPVRAIAVSAGAVWVGGEFQNAGGEPTADYAAVFGADWNPVGPPINSTTGAITGFVHALAVSGSKLFIGGYFFDAAGNPDADFAIFWTGSAWSSLGAGPDGPVYALAYDAAANDLYVGGAFQNTNGDPAIDYLARFDVEFFSWNALGNGVNLYVRALVLSGNSLYVGGDFTDANGIPAADYIAKWDKSTNTWSALGSSAINDTVYAIALSGTSVFVGGHFTNAAGLAPADRVARWNGSVWSPLGSNGFNDGALMQGGVEPPGAVAALSADTSALYAGGSFLNAGGDGTADHMAAYGLGTINKQRPDGRIRKLGGTYVGNDIYNTTGNNQTRQGSASPGGSVTFEISIQNDGTTAGKFRVAATGSGNVNYQVNYFAGGLSGTNITAAVVAGTYVTGKVEVGAATKITVQVNVPAGAPEGSSVTRVVYLTSNANANRVDVVQLVAKRL